MVVIKVIKEFKILILFLVGLDGILIILIKKNYLICLLLLLFIEKKIMCDFFFFLVCLVILNIRCFVCLIRSDFKMINIYSKVVW